jgi:Tfp pilus assembly protein PilV
MSRLRPAREEGIALVMALLIMFVLSVTLTSVVFYSSSNARDASRSKAAQQAYALAEAALNDGAAQIASHYPNQSLWSSSWAATGGPVSYSAGSGSWSSSFASTSATTGTWTITGTGTVSNPTGPGVTALTRTVTGKVDVSFDSTPSPLWQYVYSGGDTSITQSGSFAVPIWVAGNLSLSSSATIAAPATLVVGGNLTLSQPQNSVGTVLSKLSEAHVVGSCKYTNNLTQTPCTANSVLTNVWAQTFDNSLPNPPLPNPAMSTSDWQNRYSISSPSSSSCTWTGSSPGLLESAGSTTLDNSAGTFSLTPSGATYACTTASGSISWNGTKLTVSGTVFIDGNVQVTTPNNSPASYAGVGNIFASGTLTFQNNSALCAKISGNSCDTVYGHWDPSSAMLILAADNYSNAATAVTVKGAAFQGGLYGQSAISIQTSSSVQGPIVSATTISDAQTGAATFPPLQFLSPAYPLDPYTIGPLYGHTG